MSASIQFICGCDGFTCQDSPKFNFARLEDPETDISFLDDGDEVVINQRNIKLNYDKMKVEHTSVAGFKRPDLVRLISNDCRKIYNAEQMKYLVLVALHPVDEANYNVEVDS